MDGQDKSYQPGVDLPRPQSEAVDNSLSGPNQVNAPQAAEIESKSAEKPLSSTPAPQPLVQTTTDPAPVAPPQPPPLDDVQTTHIPVTSDTPAQAQDADLIEQEWVSKAKAIVDNTKSDPYSQNKEINKIKADYIRKRYNKEIKVESD